jgi:hypothetical protein
MQTFMKMAGAVYTMAGLGSIEDSKLFRENFELAIAEKEKANIRLSFKVLHNKN